MHTVVADNVFHHICLLIINVGEIAVRVCAM